MTTATQAETRRVRTDALQTRTDISPAKVTPSVSTKPVRVKRAAHTEDPRIAAANIVLVSWEHRTYRVESASTPGTFHLVKRSFSEWTCSCASTRTCWHIRSVMPRLVADLRRQRAMMHAWVQDMVRPGLVPTQPIMPVSEPAEHECCDLEPMPEPATRTVEGHAGWDYKPATDDVMVMYGW